MMRPEAPRFDTGLACLIAAVVAMVGAHTRQWWAPGPLLGDWIASCAIALAFAAIACGFMHVRERRGVAAVAGGAVVLLLMILL